MKKVSVSELPESVWESEHFQLHLPAERVGHLLVPGVETHIKSRRGELEMLGVSDKQKDHMESIFHMVYLVPPTRFELVFRP